jgi:hypothetical protein
MKESVMSTSTTSRPRNVFAGVTTLAELELEFEMRTSPENISWDGERPVSEIRRAFAEYKRQFAARAKELAS